MSPTEKAVLFNACRTDLQLSGDAVAASCSALTSLGFWFLRTPKDIEINTANI